MKIRILSITCVMAAAALLAACTAVYKNTDACEQLMRSKLAETSFGTSSDTLKVNHTGTGIHGSRVVVEGSIEHVVAPVAASAAAASGTMATAPRTASGAGAASATSVGASGASVASAASAASATNALSLKPANPQKILTPTAAECTYQGPTLDVFSWLAPANLVTPATSTTN